MIRRRLVGLSELAVLLLGAWLSLASSSDDESSSSSSGSPPVPSGQPCSVNTDCPGFVADLCAYRVECGAEKVCISVAPTPCTQALGMCEEFGCEVTTGACFVRKVADGGSCSDNNTCTSNDQCSAGQCVSQPVQCPPNGPCASYACNPSYGSCDVVAKAEGATCTDGDKCTGNDRCSGGSCVGDAVLCDDGNSCTTDSCDKTGGCKYALIADGYACDDGNTCTLGDACQGGACLSGASNDGGGCEDNDPCTSGEACAAGKCAGGQPVMCADDGRPCTTDVCQTGLGCTYGVDLGKACTPGGPGANYYGCALTGHCQEQDWCQPDTFALAGTPCDDGRVCTLGDACDGSGFCKTTPQVVGAPCDDGDACTEATTCDAANACTFPQGVSCDDQNPCTVDACDSVVGCTHEPAGTSTACDDQNNCTTNSTCDGAGKCGGGVNACEDGNACTQDGCAGTDCTHTPLAPTVACDGGHGCYGGFCNGSGQCAYGTAPTCNDGNVCTTDSCNPSSGCVNSAIDCDDDEPCTADSCNPVSGCSHLEQIGGAGCPLESSCTDGLDNDDDGLVDCAARGCFRSTVWCSAKEAVPYTAKLTGTWLTGFGAANPVGAGWSVGSSAAVTPAFGPQLLMFTGAAGVAVTEAPPPTYFATNTATAMLCCWDTPSTGLFLTWLDYVDWDTGALPANRQVRVFTASPGPTAVPSATLTNTFIPWLSAEQGHWIRRNVVLPPNVKVGVAFEISLSPAPSGNPGEGWFIDDLSVLAGEACDTSGSDWNLDGNVGCADPLCRVNPACDELVCDNGLDDNGDGLTDCADQSCFGKPGVCP